MAGVGAQATQLDFHQAMQDFRFMFPEMDASVIEAVLRSNHGAVHATIDQLLTMSTDIEADLMREDRLPPALLLQQSVPDVVPTTLHSFVQRRDSCEDLLTWDGRGEHANATCHTSPAIMIGEQPPSYSLFASPPPSYHQAVMPPLSSEAPTSPPSLPRSLTPLRRSRHWRPPLLLPLPPDFLRLPPARSQGMGVLSPQHLTQRLSENAQAREAVGGSDAELAQYLADERVALFLQNDEFMHELRANRDFMAALQREYEERVDASGCWEEGRREVAGGGGERREAGASKGGWNKLGHVDDATLRARIATMGKASRKKFAQIARVFSRSGKRCSGSPGGGSGGVSAAGVRLGGGDGSVLQAAVAREGGGTATDHLLEAAHPLIDEEDEEEEKILDDIVIGSVDVADLKEELAPMSLPQLSSSPRRAR